MKITFIIPTFNRASFLPMAVRSVFDQHGSYDLDVLIVDDGSTDNTPDVITEICKNYPQVRTVRQENAGISAARNTGLRNLLDETEIVTFLDSDDILPLNRLASDLPLFEENPKLDITYGRMLITDDLDYDAGKPKPDARKMELCSIQLACILMRRHVLDHVGFFDETLRLAEDTDFLFRIFELGFSFQQVDTICVYYLRHTTNITNDGQSMQSSCAHAILKSMKRRRANPALKLVKPEFDLSPVLEHGWM